MANEAAWNSGWQMGADVIAARRARKQALSDSEFEMKANRYASELAANQDALKTIDKDQNPTAWAGKVADMQRNLQDIRELYHPDRHPDAVSRFGHLITDKIGLTNAQSRIQNEAARRMTASVGDEREAQGLAASASAAPPNEVTAFRQKLIEGGFTAADADKAARVRYGLEAKPTAPKPETESARTRADFVAFKETHPEYKGTFEAWRAGQSAQGRGEAPKRMSNDDRFLSIQQKRAAGQPLSEDDKSFAQGYRALIKLKVIDPKVAGYQALGSSRVGEYVDPENPLETIVTTGADAMRRGLKGKSSIDFRIQMPTAQERGRADLATSAREQLSTMEDILKDRSDLFGPVSGRETDFETWVGSQDPDAQRFRAAARIASDHLAGVFGGRSEAALQGIYDVVGRNATNPEAGIAALEQMNLAAGTILQRGTMGGAGGPTPTPGALKKKAQQNLGTDPLGVLP